MQSTGKSKRRRSNDSTSILISRDKHVVLRARANELEEKLIEMSHRAGENSGANKMLQTQRDELQAQIKSMNKEMMTMHADLALAKNNVVQLKKKVAELETRAPQARTSAKLQYFMNTARTENFFDMNDDKFRKHFAGYIKNGTSKKLTDGGKKIPKDSPFYDIAMERVASTTMDFKEMNKLLTKLSKPTADFKSLRPNIESVLREMKLPSGGGN